MPFIDQKELFDKTDGGRLVIEQYYPQSVESFNNHHRKFKCRTSEKTASASVMKTEDGVWLVTDFGGDQKPRNCIQVAMHEEGIDFGAAINLIAAQFNIVPEKQRAEVFKPEIRQRDAEKDEHDGEWQFEPKEFTLKEVKAVLAPKVFDFLVYQVSKDTTADKVEEKVLKEVSKVFKKYRFVSLASFTIIKNRKATIIRSTDIFPLFMFDEGKWKKIYKPREVLGSNRFMYYGKEHMPKDFLFGYETAKKAYDEVIKIEDDGEIDPDDSDKKPSEKKIKKLKNIFMVSGGSDALNLAVIGQCFKKDKDIEQTAEMLYPVWMNSETAKLSKGQWDNLRKLSENTYNIPDIDATGKKQAHLLALEYLDLKTVYLPEELKERKDSFRSKPLKDLRDYFRYFKVWDFFTLIKTAYPYRFWDSVPPTDKKNKWTYNVNNKHLYNFLSRNGFYRFETEAEKDGYIYIRIEGNIVRKIEPKRIRDFINQFIETRNPDVELMNTFLRTNQLNEASLSNLPFIKIDFTDFDKETQWIFFKDSAAQIKADGITLYKAGDADKYVWEDEVIDHKMLLKASAPEPMADFFTIAAYSSLKTRETSYSIQLHNTDCLVLRYLMNGSRLLWREELETRMDGIKSEKDREEYAVLFRLTKEEEKLMDGLPDEAAKEAYRKAHRWTLDGPLLTEDERHDQQLQLINKIFAIGYIFHRHKENGKPWAIWGMDAKLSDGGESHGGSGKSLLPKLIFSERLMKTQYREGRNPKLIDNPHFYEGCDRHTDLMLVDDCSRYLKFDFFFSAIGGPITVNPKNNKQYTIDADEAMKFWFTSNFPPYDADISTERRIIYMLYSDYYHYNRMGEYREDRSVLDEFGKNFGKEFTPEEWRWFLSFIMQCVKFYLGCQAKINPPMDNVNKRNLKSVMGDAFEPWADVYFSPESERLNTLVVKEEALNDYVKSTNQKNLTTNRFTKSLKAWCHYNNYVLNPKEMLGAGGRLIKRVKINPGTMEEKELTKEMIYIKTMPVLEAVIDRYEKRTERKEAEETAAAGAKDDKIPF